MLAALSCARRTPAAPTRKRKHQDGGHGGDCVVCLEENCASRLVTPCGHQALCATCAGRFKIGDKCPVCRKQVTGIVEVFVAAPADLAHPERERLMAQATEAKEALARVEKEVGDAQQKAKEADANRQEAEAQRVRYAKEVLEIKKVVQHEKQKAADARNLATQALKEKDTSVAAAVEARRAAECERNSAQTLLQKVTQGHGATLDADVKVPCSARRPVVGERVMRQDGESGLLTDKDGNVDAWVLFPGEISTVTAVDRDGDLRLRNPRGVESCWTFRELFCYCQEAGSSKPYLQVSTPCRPATASASSSSSSSSSCGLPPLLATAAADAFDDVEVVSASTAAPSPEAVARLSSLVECSSVIARDALMQAGGDFDTAIRLIFTIRPRQ